MLLKYYYQTVVYSFCFIIFFLQDLVQSTDSGPTFWLVWYSGKHGSRGQL